jgi:DNA-binding transcriptional regulator GbsR (MarR family)
VELPDTSRKFILHWGEMGTRWGINRTVAQIHALLLVAPEPLAADQIVDLLGVARSNVSTSLRELQNWGIVRVVHVFGDRRDHFETLSDVWEMFGKIMEERKRRELDPCVSMLQQCIAEADEADSDADVVARLGELLEFLETAGACFEQLHRLPPSALKQAGRLRSLLGSTVTD